MVQLRVAKKWQNIWYEEFLGCSTKIYNKANQNVLKIVYP